MIKEKAQIRIKKLSALLICTLITSFGCKNDLAKSDAIETKYKTTKNEDEEIRIDYWPNGFIRKYEVKLLDSIIYVAEYDGLGICQSTKGTWGNLNGRVDKSINGVYGFDITFYPRYGYKRLLSVQNSKGELVGAIKEFPENEIRFDTFLKYSGPIDDTLTLYFAHLDTNTGKGITTYFHTW